MDDAEARRVLSEVRHEAGGLRREQQLQRAAERLGLRLRRVSVTVESLPRQASQVGPCLVVTSDESRWFEVTGDRSSAVDVVRRLGADAGSLSLLVAEPLLVPDPLAV